MLSTCRVHQVHLGKACEIFVNVPTKYVESVSTHFVGTLQWHHHGQCQVGERSSRACTSCGGVKCGIHGVWAHGRPTRLLQEIYSLEGTESRQWMGTSYSGGLMT